MLSLSVHRLPQVKAQQPIQNQGAALVQVGKKYYDAGQFSEAAQVLQQAAQADQAAADGLKQAQALSWMSLAQQKLGHWQEAQAAIDASLSLLESVSRDDQSDRVRAQVLNAQGHLQLAKGKAEAALETWQKAEVRYAQADDIAGVLGSQINQVQALQSLGLYRRAQKLLAQIEQQLEQSTDSPLKATGLNNLGNIRRRDGELEQSKSILSQSLSVAQRLRLPQAESQAWLSLGNTERSQAKRAEDLNNAAQAKQYNQEALNNYQQAATIATVPITKIQAQLNQLSLLIETDQLTSIPALLPQISEALNQLPASRASVYAHVNFAQSLMKLEREPEIIQNSQIIAQLLGNAIQQAETLEDQQAKSYALGTLGQLSEKTKNWSDAQKYTLAALYIAQEINAPDLTYQWQWQMGRLLQAESESTTHSQDANAEAIAYYTQSLRILKDLRSDLVALNPDIQFSFRESVEPVYRQLVDLLLRAEQPS
ncbi:MAG: CHAT domain-containing protein, partial [Microcystaceae cyanobacterium]